MSAMWIRWESNIATSTGCKDGWFACLIDKEDPAHTLCGSVIYPREEGREDRTSDPLPCYDCGLRR